jgi:glyoxylase-like metal-dependent hydrolase (beta-lactamase superfamily II)
MTRDSDKGITEIQPNIYLIKTPPPGCHVYLIKGTEKNILIDASSTASFPVLKESLGTQDLDPEDIDLVILSHEHFDHIGAAVYLFETSLVAAHHLAANKIELQDEFTTMHQYFNVPDKRLRVHLWLEDGIVMDLGNYQLQLLYTPGHTSGCICVYELSKKLLFSGDTVFPGGTVSDIRASGNAADYFNSLQRLSLLKIEHLYPGHGRVSDKPAEDIDKALQFTRTLFEESKILFQALSQKVLRERAKGKR